MKLRSTILIVLTVAYGILWLGGIASYTLFSQPLPESSWAAPAFLFLAAFVILFSSKPKQGLDLCVAGIIGYGFEVLGVHTGFPFGQYKYTETVHPILFGVPLVMIPAWIILIAYTQQFIINFKLKRKYALIASALTMVWIDLLIDPVAIGRMNFWTWLDHGWYYGIPLWNFLGWFLASLGIFAFVIRNTDQNSWHSYIGASVLLFFTVIAFADKLVLAGIFGSTLLIFHFFAK